MSCLDINLLQIKRSDKDSRFLDQPQHLTAEKVGSYACFLCIPIQDDKELMCAVMSRHLSGHDLSGTTRAQTTIPLFGHHSNRKVGVHCLVSTAQGTGTP